MSKRHASSSPNPSSSAIPVAPPLGVPSSNPIQNDHLQPSLASNASSTLSLSPGMDFRAVFSPDTFSSASSTEGEARGSAGSANSVPAWGWQGSKNSVLERLQYLLGNCVLSDVTFVVGKDAPVRMPAHKFVLTMGSAVFDAMFNGPLAIKDKEIHLPDIEQTAFATLLKFLYTDELGDITHYSVMTTLYVAKKYAVPALQAACVQFLKSNLCPSNAFLLVTQARMFAECELANLCLEMIDKHTAEAIAAEGFLELDHETLCCVLERDTLHIREIRLYNAADKWAEQECIRRGTMVDAARKREVLGNALDLIRFPVMTIEEFALGPAQSGLLSDKESNQMFLYFTLNPKPDTRFICMPRSCVAGKEYVCSRFQSTDSRWGYSGTADRIRFTVDRQIFVMGLGLYGSVHGPAEYSVSLQLILSSNQRVIANHDTTFTTDGSEAVFRVMFKKPVEVTPQTHYTISACMKGPDSHYGTRGARKVCKQISKDSSVTFNFIYSPGNNNGTSVEDGQIPEIIFYTA